MCVGLCVCVLVCACVCVCWFVCVCVGLCVCVCARTFLHVKALLKALVYMIFSFNYIMDVVSVVVFYLVIISDATNEFPLGDDKDLLN